MKRIGICKKEKRWQEDFKSPGRLGSIGKKVRKDRNGGPILS